MTNCLSFSCSSIAETLVSFDYWFPKSFCIAHAVIPTAFIHSDLRDETAFNRKAAAAAKLPPNATFFIENFTYSNSVILERMYKHMSNISFVGITVSIQELYLSTCAKR